MSASRNTNRTSEKVSKPDKMEVYVVMEKKGNLQGIAARLIVWVWLLSGMLLIECR